MSAHVVHIVVGSDDLSTYAPATLCKRNSDQIAQRLILPKYDAARIYDPAVRGIYSAVAFCERCIAEATIWDQAYRDLYGEHYFMYSAAENADRIGRGASYVRRSF